MHTNYVLPGRLGAREVEELGEEERERSSREEGERSPGLNRFHSKDFFSSDFFLVSGEGEIGAVETTGGSCCVRGAKHIYCVLC